MSAAAAVKAPQSAPERRPLLPRPTLAAPLSANPAACMALLMGLVELPAFRGLSVRERDAAQYIVRQIIAGNGRAVLRHRLLAWYLDCSPRVALAASRAVRSRCLGLFAYRQSKNRLGGSGPGIYTLGAGLVALVNRSFRGDENVTPHPPFKSNRYFDVGKAKQDPHAAPVAGNSDAPDPPEASAPPPPAHRARSGTDDQDRRPQRAPASPAAQLINATEQIANQVGGFSDADRRTIVSLANTIDVAQYGRRFLQLLQRGAADPAVLVLVPWARAALVCEMQNGGDAIPRSLQRFQKSEARRDAYSRERHPRPGGVGKPRPEGASGSKPRSESEQPPPRRRDATLSPVSLAAIIPPPQNSEGILTYLERVGPQIGLRL